MPSDIKWIVFGGSYAGSLAAWARLKYPYLVHGAVSSSGPLLAKVDFEGKYLMNFYYRDQQNTGLNSILNTFFFFKEYFQVVRDSLNSYNKKCTSNVALANQELDIFIKSESGREKITKTFQ